MDSNTATFLAITSTKHQAPWEKLKEERISGVLAGTSEEESCHVDDREGSTTSEPSCLFDIAKTSALITCSGE
jgi:hypothetical protein